MEKLKWTSITIMYWNRAMEKRTWICITIIRWKGQCTITVL